MKHRQREQHRRAPHREEASAARELHPRERAQGLRHTLHAHTCKAPDCPDQLNPCLDTGNRYCLDPQLPFKLLQTFREMKNTAETLSRGRGRPGFQHRLFLESVNRCPPMNTSDLARMKELWQGRQVICPLKKCVFSKIHVVFIINSQRNISAANYL